MGPATALTAADLAGLEPGQTVEVTVTHLASSRQLYRGPAEVKLVAGHLYLSGVGLALPPAELAHPAAAEGLFALGRDRSAELRPAG